MSKEYIEKEQAREAFLKSTGCHPFDWHYFKTYINGIPPADVKPVVRGEWITDYCAANGHSDIYCSVCNKDATYFVGSSDEIHWSEKHPVYCPNCGADMRKENTHEN